MPCLQKGGVHVEFTSLDEMLVIFFPVSLVFVFGAPALVFGHKEQQCLYMYKLLGGYAADFNSKRKILP